MLKFCFPERDPDAIEEGEEEGEKPGSKKLKKKPKDSNSNFYVKRDKKDKDDVEKMKVLNSFLISYNFCFHFKK